MLREKEIEDRFIYNFKLEDYIPSDHLLRLIDNHIDFSFIIDRIKHLYSYTGRPSIDPVVLIKMLLIGYLYDIKSERQIEKEIQVNLAYRWFIKYNIEESIPDHSTISQTRRRKFSESGIFQEIFDEIVRQIKAHGFISGETIFTDSTHIKANASIKSLREVVVTPKEYLDKLDEEALKDEESDADNFKQKDKKKISNDTHRSKSDPDSRLMERRRKPKGLYYLDHRSIDSSGYITDSYITPGNCADCEPYIDRLLRQIQAFKFRIKNVVADKGYGIGSIYSRLTNLGIEAYIPKQQREKIRESMFTYSDYEYVKDGDYYICPAGQKLRRRSKKPNGNRNHVYSCSSELCNSKCSYRKKCINTKVPNRAKTLKRNIYHEEIEYQLRKREDSNWRDMLKKRMYLMEGSFADSKANHGLNRARYRGLDKVQEQSLMIATAQNIKKYIKELKKTGENISAKIISMLNHSLLIFAD